MDPTEITKHIPEIVGVAKVAAASIPFTGIVKRMFGPAADEVAEMWRDEVRIYRYGRQVKLLEKVEKMAQEAGFNPQAVPPKILFPLLEGASFEDNEDLHTMWAGLLANAAHPESGEILRPSFISILRELAPDEAAVLNWIFDNSHDSPAFRNFRISVTDLATAFIGLGLATEGNSLHGLSTLENEGRQRLETCIDGLQASQLIRRHNDSDDDLYYRLTFRGRDFVRACRPPKAKS
ncbi:MAG: Abi-alpha family protein [Acidobacteriota bacterium]